MAKDPAFLFYSSDFMMGVTNLTMEERGQYITLLCIQHQKGRLSRKAVAIAVPNATADVMAKFKEDENGFFYNERLEIEANKRKEHAEKQRQRAIDGWKKRKKQQEAGAYAVALPLENEDVNEDVNNKFNFKSSLIQLGVEKQIASDWLKVRSKKKAVNTEIAFEGIKNQIEKCHLTPTECIKEAVEKSWAGFKADWVKDIQSKKSQKNNGEIPMVY